MATKEQAGQEAVVILQRISEGLPEGYRVTNKKAVKKRIRKIGGHEETRWTSWVKNCTTKGLAYLNNEEKVILILEKDYKNFYFNGKPA